MYDLGDNLWTYRNCHDGIYVTEHKVIKSTVKTFKMHPDHRNQVNKNLKKADVTKPSEGTMVYTSSDAATIDALQYATPETSNVTVITYKEFLAEVDAYDAAQVRRRRLYDYEMPRTEVKGAHYNIKWDNLVEGEHVNIIGHFGKRKVTVLYPFDNHGYWMFDYEGIDNDNDNCFGTRDEAIAGLIKWIEDKIVY